MARTIFINYRREDSISIAGRLHDRLAQAFGRKNIFMDVDHIPAGVDFVAHLNSQVAACNLLLVVIGPKWLDAKDEAGQRRLQQPDDFVAIEIAAALARDIRVIPVLVDGAGMPKASELPDRLKQLARRQAVEVRQNQFGRDAEALVERIREALAGSVGIRSWRSMVLAGAATLATLLLVGWFGLSWISAPRPAGIVPSPVDKMNRIGTVAPQEGENERQRLTDLKAEQERQAKATADQEAQRKAEEAERQRLIDVKAEQERQAKATADQEAQRKAEEAERQRLIDVKAEQAAREEITIRNSSPFSGAKIANLSRALADELQLQNVERGVAIMDLKAGSVAGRIGFRRGDVVEEVNGKRIAKTRELERLSSVPNSTWAVTVLRGGQRLSVVLGYTSSRPPR
jgi:hypothetical protein